MSTYMEAARRDEKLHEYTEKLKKENREKKRYVCEGCLLKDIAPCDKKGNCNFEGYVSVAYEEIKDVIEG